MEEGNNMIIEYLEMNNFRQFKGRTLIQFSCNLEKNVTVILGDNTFGKTTLLQAFNWCFYDEVNLPHKDMLLNYEVANSLPENVSIEVYVKIGLVHNKLHYTIQRKRVYEKKTGKIVSIGNYVDMWYKTTDAQTSPIKGNEIPDVINSILPKDLSSYFFFDTERVQDVGERKNLSAAVKGLLGLTLLDNAKRHLGNEANSRSVLGLLYREKAKCSKDPKVDEAMNQITIKQEMRDTLSKEIDEVKEEIANYEERIGELNRILASAKETRLLHEQRKKLEIHVKRDMRLLDDTRDEIRRKIKDNFADFYFTPLVEQALTLLKRAKVDDKGVKDLTAVTLKALLERGVCVCGQKLEEGSDAYNHILEEIRFVPPESIGTLVKNYKDQLNQHRKDGRAILNNIEKTFGATCSLEASIDADQTEIKKISDKIKRSKDLSLEEQERNNAQERVESLTSTRDDKKSTYDKLGWEIENFQNFINRNRGDSDKFKRLEEVILYTKALCKWIQMAYEKKEIEIRSSLQQKVNDIFQQIYTGKRMVELDGEYHVKLITNVGGENIESGESEGLKRVKNFAFISGLVSLAKEKIIVDAGTEKFNLASEPYPLVMDAPFSNADEKHTTNISRVLPTVAEQVIMFVMQKDWNYAEKVMHDKVGAQYKLNKINDVHTQLEVIQHV